MMQLVQIGKVHVGYVLLEDKGHQQHKSKVA